MSGRPHATAARRSAPLPTSPEEQVVWHDLECGTYRRDLVLWRRLAERASGPVLDIGAGSGRVALDLVRAGHTVIAVDSDEVLLDALRERAGGLPVRCVHADARELSLPERDLALCVVPMQTVQLLGGVEGRARLLGAVRAHLRPGALLACAIVERLDTFDEADGAAPPADNVRVDGTLYVSRPTAVRELEDTIVLERQRELVPAGRRRRRRRNVIVLDRLSASDLKREMRAAGFAGQRARHIPSTADHVGSTVVIGRA